MTEIGMALYNYRAANNLSQRDVAYSLGLSQNAVCMIEKGKRAPRKATAERIYSLIGEVKREQEEVKDEQEETDYVPFTDRLAQSRGYKDMADYKAKTFGLTKAEEPAQIPREDAQAVLPKEIPVKELARLQGYLEGLQAALKIDATEQIEMLKKLLEGTND